MFQREKSAKAKQIDSKVSKVFIFTIQIMVVGRKAF